jgi:mono/diheme cytochrome c family protein
MRSIKFLFVLVIAAAAYLAPSSAVWAGDAAKGAYIFKAAGCGNCHTDPGKKGKGARPKGEPLAGGRPLKTPFGTFYTPNITPSQAGMGAWSFADFQRAMLKGEAPNGAPYYPAFPYTSYTGMTTEDLGDLWAYLKSQKASDQANQSHELKFPFNIRALMYGWRLLFFTPGNVGDSDPGKSAQWKRGAYLVRVLAHCGECHTPRNVMGAMERSRELSGNPEGPGGKVPDLSSANKKGVVTWSQDDVIEYLSSGMTPEGDFAGGEMAEVIDHSTGILTESDRTAIAVFVKSLE